MTGISVAQWYHLNDSQSQKSSFKRYFVVHLCHSSCYMCFQYMAYSHVKRIDCAIKTKSSCKQYIFDSLEIACKTFWRLHFWYFLIVTLAQMLWCLISRALCAVHVWVSACDVTSNLSRFVRNETHGYTFAWSTDVDLLAGSEFHLRLWLTVDLNWSVSYYTLTGQMQTCMLNP